MVRILSPDIIPLHKKTTLASVLCFLKPPAVGACSALLRNFTMNSNVSFPIFPVLWRRPKWHQGIEPTCVWRPGLRSLTVWPQQKQIPQGSEKVVLMNCLFGLLYSQKSSRKIIILIWRTLCLSVTIIKDNMVSWYSHSWLPLNPSQLRVRQHSSGMFCFQL